MHFLEYVEYYFLKETNENSNIEPGILMKHNVKGAKGKNNRHHSDISDASLQLGEVVLFKMPLEAITSYRILNNRARWVQKWSPDERSIMSADGTVPMLQSPLWLTGVPRRYCKLELLQKWSPDERSIMSADGTVPMLQSPLWLTGVPRRYCKSSSKNLHVILGLLCTMVTQTFIVYLFEQDAVTVQKWSPDERSIMSADGTVPMLQSPLSLTGVPRRYCK
ncbi:hypothetical protein CDAR_303981 [Caerostris darwini]|uniref:Uncharacterized protein n=1 Tax=Caerostris darwini TaxID=1538125 RepID=A0AAV4T8R0_9ARAC|nr:hypothetical protein CDAR_303981 [Caerostris darwini]